MRDIQQDAFKIILKGPEILMRKVLKILSFRIAIPRLLNVPVRSALVTLG